MAAAGTTLAPESATAEADRAVWRTARGAARLAAVEATRESMVLVGYEPGAGGRRRRIERVSKFRHDVAMARDDEWRNRQTNRTAHNTIILLAS